MPHLTDRERSKSVQKKIIEINYISPKNRWRCGNCTSSEPKGTIMYCLKHRFDVAAQGLCADYFPMTRR